MPRQGWRYTLQSREALSFSSSQHQEWKDCNIKLWPFLNLLYTIFFFLKLHSHKLKQWLNKRIQNVIKLKVTAHYREKIGTIYHSREYFFFTLWKEHRLANTKHPSWNESNWSHVSLSCIHCKQQSLPTLKHSQE